MTSRADDSLVGAMIALQPRLRRFAFGLSQSMHEADDLVQTTFERALSRRAQFRPGTRLDSWMFRILHTVFLNQRARTSVRERHASGAAPEDCPAVGGGDGLEASVTLHQVHDILRELPESQRVALLLVAVEGLSYAEAATALDLPVGTLTSRVGRARAAVAERLHGAPNKLTPARDRLGATR